MALSVLVSDQHDSRVAPEAARESRCRRWILTFCATFFGVGALLYCSLLLIDPYDSDRFPNLGIVGVDDHNPRTAHVSRGRDPRFNAAILGSSTGRLIDPHRLDPMTGLDFTQLTVPGSGPREQLAVANWFVTHHAEPGALVLVTDPDWCSPGPKLPLEHPFPFWLYQGNAKYLANVFNSKSLDHAVWRLQLALGRRTAVDPVGYSDYLPSFRHKFHDDPALASTELAPSAADAGFPWVDALHQMVGALPPHTAVVLVMPPLYYRLLPSPGGVLAARIARCKAALSQVVAARPHSGFLDFRIDTPDAHMPENFADPIHIGARFAREIEDRLAAVLGRPQMASP